FYLGRRGCWQVDDVRNNVLDVRVRTQVHHPVGPGSDLTRLDCAHGLPGSGGAVRGEHEGDTLHVLGGGGRAWEGKLDRVDDDLGRLVIGDPQAQDAFDLWILIGRPGGQRQINGFASFHRFHRDGEVGFSHDIYFLPFIGTVVLLRAVAAGQEERVRIST